MKNSLTKLRRRELAPVLLAFLATMFLMIAFLAPATFAAEHAPYRRVAVIELKGMIGPSLHAYFESRLAKAERQGCDLVVVEIESPGGYLHDSLKIARLLQQTEWARTVAWIPKEAYSGAALIAFGCDEIVMGPDSQIGDIGIIAFDPHLNAYRYTEAKWESALVSEARQIAETKGHQPDLIESMIDKEAAVYFRATDENQIGDSNAGADAADADANIARFEFRKQIIANGTAPPLTDGDWQLLEESGLERFLTLNAQRATKFGLAVRIESDRGSMLETLAPTAEKRVFQRRFSDHFAFFLRNPWITGLLIVIGCVALYFELSAPGIGAGGMIAVLCAVLFFWSRFVGGTAGWLEVLLFVAGITFLLMEVFVIPGWGVSGLLGILLVVIGAWLASQNFVLPSESDHWNQLGRTSIVFSVSAVTVIACGAVISRYFGKIPVLSQLVLQPAIARQTVQKTDAKNATQRPHPLVSRGDWGVAESILRPAGRAKFDGNSVDVVSEGEFIEPGVEVRVLEIRGNVVVVAAVESESG